MTHRSAQVDFTLQVAYEGIDLIQQDVRVEVDVYQNGEVLMNEIAFIQYGKEDQPNANGFYDSKVTGFVSLHSGPPWVQELAKEARPKLASNEDFIAAAYKAAGLHYIGLGGNDPDGYFKWRD